MKYTTCSGCLITRNKSAGSLIDSNLEGMQWCMLFFGTLTILDVSNQTTKQGWSCHCWMSLNVLQTDAWAQRLVHCLHGLEAFTRNVAVGATQCLLQCKLLVEILIYIGEIAVSCHYNCIPSTPEGLLRISLALSFRFLYRVVGNVSNFKLEFRNTTSPLTAKPIFVS